MGRVTVWRLSLVNASKGRKNFKNLEFSTKNIQFQTEKTGQVSRAPLAPDHGDRPAPDSSDLVEVEQINAARHRPPNLRAHLCSWWQVVFIAFSQLFLNDKFFIADKKVELESPISWPCLIQNFEHIGQRLGWTIANSLSSMEVEDALGLFISINSFYQVGQDKHFYFLTPSAKKFK